VRCLTIFATKRDDDSRMLAFGMIVQREAPTDERLASERARLLALARALVHDPAEADDVVQEALAAALDRDEPLREPGPWLRQVLRNEVRGPNACVGLQPSDPATPDSPSPAIFDRRTA
jgi:hypothetical protein